jgi:hypothetical protein
VIKKTKITKILTVCVWLTILILVGLIFFIKFDTGGAANFTDNVLRPILGNGPVGLMEKTFFNFSDKLQQITDKNGLKDIPQIVNEGITSSATPIPLNKGLPSVSGEGIWRDRPLKDFPGKEVMAETFVRPDSTRPYAYVTLIQMDMTVFKLGVVAGKSQPGGPIGNYGPGKVPDEIALSGRLAAAFDGGFQYRDGNYGMIVGDKTYVPLKNDIGTLIGYKDGSLKIVNYQGQNLGNNIEFIRQNCPILVDNSQVFAENEKNKKLWGRTFNADIYTQRSGIGLTNNGNLIFAAGNNLSPSSLAEALKMAGTIDAIQLDINPFWVRFSVFEPKPGGGYSSSSLTKAMPDGSKDYLNGYSKDFFYLYRR